MGGSDSSFFCDGRGGVVVTAAEEGCEEDEVVVVVVVVVQDVSEALVRWESGSGRADDSDAEGVWWWWDGGMPAPTASAVRGVEDGIDLERREERG